MDKWRGTVVQLFFAASIVVLAWRDPKYIEHVMLLIGAILGANVTRAKVDAAVVAALSGGSVPPPPSPPSSKLPPIGTLILGVAFGVLVAGYYLT